MAKYRCMIVEDSPTMRQLIVSALSRIPQVEIVEASDGVDALKKLPGRKIDLMLTDVNMPIMDGLRLVSLLKGNPLYREIPVVIIAADGAAEDRDKGLALLAPGGSNLVVHRVEDGRVFARLEPPLQTDRRVPSVDRLLVSAAEAYGSRLIALVLTGMGDDGSRGIRAARAAGGLTIAEAEETCVVFGMPREAIRTGAVQRVVPLSGIGAAIAREVACRREAV